MRRDLAVVAGLALVDLLLALFAAPSAVRAPLLVPLVLILPGYAVAARLFPPGAASVAERGVYTVVFSLAISAVAAVALQVVLGLSRDVFAVVLSGVTILAALIRPPRRRRDPIALALPRALPVAIVAFLLAAGVCTAAIVSASDGLGKADSRIRFTDLWMLPEASSEAGPQRVTIGVQNHERQAVAYRLRLLRGAQIVKVVPFSLDSGETWERGFAIARTPTGLPLKAELARGTEIYRYVELESSP